MYVTRVPFRVRSAQDSRSVGESPERFSKYVAPFSQKRGVQSFLVVLVKGTDNSSRKTPQRRDVFVCLF